MRDALEKADNLLKVIFILNLDQIKSNWYSSQIAIGSNHLVLTL